MVDWSATFDDQYRNGSVCVGSYRKLRVPANCWSDRARVIPALYATLHLLFCSGSFQLDLCFGHEFKGQPGGGLHWDRWAIVGVLLLAATTYVCFRGFTAVSQAKIPE